MVLVGSKPSFQTGGAKAPPGQPALLHYLNFNGKKISSNLARIAPKNRPKTVFLDVKENYPTGLMDYNLSASWDQAWHKALT